MNALLSVSDKTGLSEFAQGLIELGFSLIATGSTAAALRGAGIAVREVSEFTGFPEILSGRVKTLHPRIHAGILAKNEPEHQAELDQHGLERFEVVAVNLYPFAESLAKGEAFEATLEQIDIGGPALLRAAAKNHAAVLPVCDPADYPLVLEALKQGPELDFRRHLAAKVFRLTASYDSLIAGWLSGEPLPEQMVWSLVKKSGLRYGENPHQKAALYQLSGETGPLFQAEILGGKEMSYNNYGDAEAAWNLAGEFEAPAAVVVKHQIPCGVATGPDIVSAYQKAHDADPVSIFGGIVALNRTVTARLAQALSQVFLELVLAPDYEPQAQEILAQKKNLRVLRLPIASQSPYLEAKRLRGGFLLQEADQLTLDPAQLRTVTAAQVPADLQPDLELAWQVVKHARSNAIVVAKNGATLGIGAGQTSRIEAAQIALNHAGAASAGAVMASDAYFPFDDVVKLAAEHGIAAIMQPGGSIKDPDSIAAANAAGIAMVFTGMRHFRH